MLQVSVIGLERALQQYVKNPSAHNTPFDLKLVPVSAQPLTAAPERKKPSVAVEEPAVPAKKAGEGERNKTTTRTDLYAGAFDCEFDWNAICDESTVRSLIDDLGRTMRVCVCVSTIVKGFSARAICQMATFFSRPMR